MQLSAVIRCDASAKIGSGHVMRCLALTEAMQKRGWDVSFYVNEEALSVAPFLKDAGVKIYTLDSIPPKCDLVIIDHYELNDDYERSVKDWAAHVLVIDDVGHRTHECDFLMDYAALDAGDEARHTINEDCICFFGLQYAMLRPQFLKPVIAPQTPPRKIHMFFGGTDVARLTLKLIKTILEKKLQNQYIFQIIITKANPDKEEITGLCAGHKNLELHIQVQDMAALIRECDLAIGVGGVAMWERLAMKIPVIEFAHSEIQLETLTKLKGKNAIFYAGMGEEIMKFLNDGEFEKKLQSPPELNSMEIGSNLSGMLHEIEDHIKSRKRIRA